jgi:N-acetylglucosamine-6-phosphate deacetylase
MDTFIYYINGTLSTHDDCGIKLQECGGRPFINRYRCDECGCNLHEDDIIFVDEVHHVSKEDSLSIIQKAPHRIIAVTDAMSAAGCFDGEYAIGSLPVDVKDGVARLKGSQTLAGSTLTMVDSFINYFNLVGFESAVEFTSLNPAKLLGIDPPKSHIGIKDGLVTHLN